MRPFLDPAVDTPLTKGSGDTAKTLCFSAICRTFRSGGTRIRTGDTMIFSHVLYQLSYPAGRLAGSDSTVLARSYQASGRLPGTAGSVRPARLSGFGEAVELEGGLDHLFGERADDGLGLLARLEERYGRDAGDPEVAGERRLGVHIDLRNLHRSIVLGGDLVHDRGNLPARPAPRRPEVNQYGDLGIQNFVLESVYRNRYGL